MHRKELIHALAQKSKRNINYLEIGVSTGRIFFDVPTTSKVGVDPLFKFSTFKRLRRTIKDPRNIFAKFFPMTSDRFFAENASELFKGNKIDVCLIDGMHEFEYALRDIENTLQYLNNNGVIVIHDCNPQTSEMAGSFENWKSRGFAGGWNGDVWKAIVFIRSHRKDVNVFVVDSDNGLGIVTIGKPESMLNFKTEQIHSLTYEDFDKNREEWLNLKPVEELSRYLNLN